MIRWGLEVGRATGKLNALEKEEVAKTKSGNNTLASTMGLFKKGVLDCKQGGFAFLRERRRTWTISL